MSRSSLGQLHPTLRRRWLIAAGAKSLPPPISIPSCEGHARRAEGKHRRSSLSRLGAILAETRRPPQTTPTNERQSREADQQHRGWRNFRDRCRGLRHTEIPERAAKERIRSWVAPVQINKIGRRSKSVNDGRQGVASVACRRKGPLDRPPWPSHGETVLRGYHFEAQRAQICSAKGRVRAQKVATLKPGLIGGRAWARRHKGTQIFLSPTTDDAG